jgi:hypothetical protein
VKTLFAIALVATIAGCAQLSVERVAPVPAVPSVASAPLLGNAGFEEEYPAAAPCPPKWTCLVHVDWRSFLVTSDATASEGKRGALITYVGPEPWATVLQSLPPAALANRRARFSLAVKLADVTEPGGGIYIKVEGPSTSLDFRKDLRTGTQDWQRLALEFVVPPGAHTVDVGAMLHGKGRLWIDDARLEFIPAP